MSETVLFGVSSPIYAANLGGEYQEHYTKRFPSEKAFMLSENNQNQFLPQRFIQNENDSIQVKN